MSRLVQLAISRWRPAPEGATWEQLTAAWKQVAAWIDLNILVP